MQQKCSAFLWKNQINKITRSGDCAYQNYKILVRAQIFYRLTLMQFVPMQFGIWQPT
jgi:hypothetical protein